MITVVGNLVADPETRIVSGHKLAKLRIASNERIKDNNGQWRDGDTTYIDIACWRRLAEGSESLRKGQKVIVYGKLKGRSFERNDGTKGYAYEIEASEVGASVAVRSSSKVEPDLDNPWQ
jgi:single-strand DNA-binding protein